MDYIDPVKNARAISAYQAQQEREREIARLEGRLAVAEAMEEEGVFDHPLGPGDDPAGMHPLTGYSGPADAEDRTAKELRADLKRLVMEQGNPF